ncbi:MAG: N-6 DNA methylase, partial [Polyangiaceae bacterium]|nr:N-6 DNA methylase [Polyangiaceae bacterium]
MPLSWNEITHRAIRFSSDWRGVGREQAERQTFWNEFFDVFGVSRRRVAAYEEPVRKISGNYGFIDLIWPGTLIVEHKSAGEDLDKAHSQAMAYIRALGDQGRGEEAPRYVIVSDFARIRLYDLEPDEIRAHPHLDDVHTSATIEFPLDDLSKNLRHFAFIAGYKHQKLDPEDPANEKATLLMCELHDALFDGGYEGHELRCFLVRILFCLFAEDNGIFEPNIFELYIKNRTKEDGSDLGPALARLFEVLNTPVERRQKYLDEDLSAFPYVNGNIFAERLGFADFNRDMRNRLLACTAFHWERISPAVFGSLFQSVMDSKSRRQVGAHYTAEKNILKLIRSLFLDELREELARIRQLKVGKKQRLAHFQDKLAKLSFFDPACGCGNFLVLTYRELRRLELETLRELYPSGQQELSLHDVNNLSKLNVDQFYGIEIEEFPARIAEVALWLADHQANLELSLAFSQMVNRLPLRSSPHIHVGNALWMDWREVLLPEKCSYILGNPPFVGKHYQTEGQRNDIKHVMGDSNNTGDLDYVTAWYFKAAEYIQGHASISVAFVSTNSITQGEQVPVFFRVFLEKYQMKIYFAHRTFKWESETRGKAHVHCVIIGFGQNPPSLRAIYDYTQDNDDATATMVDNISPYLTQGADAFVTKRTKPFGNVPEMRCGNKPSDGGHLLLTDAEKGEFLRIEPNALPYIRRFTGSEEFINGKTRWCLWLKDIEPAALRKLPAVLKRVEAVREFRQKSTAKPTREAAIRPTEFFYINQPEKRYIAIPEVSSERRSYIPIGLLSPEVVPSNKIYVIRSDDVCILGVMMSAMHNAWMRLVAGRLESRYQYSGSMVYNTFPWPEASKVQRAAIGECARGVLDVRGKYPASTLADLYDPVAMPAELAIVHRRLDHAVER